MGSNGENPGVGVLLLGRDLMVTTRATATMTGTLLDDPRGLDRWMKKHGLGKAETDPPPNQGPPLEPK